jgi:hypothetical protein
MAGSSLNNTATTCPEPSDFKYGNRESCTRASSQAGMWNTFFLDGLALANGFEPLDNAIVFHYAL